jgi:transcriptional regulator with XRE-family HTH domain
LFKVPGQFAWNNYSIADPSLKLYLKSVEFAQLPVEDCQECKMASKLTFGQNIRFFRERCSDRERKRGLLSQERLGELIGAKLGIEGGFTGATISNWERDEKRPYSDQRDILMALVQTLHECEGIQTIEEANQLLESGDYRALNEDEIAHCGFPPAFIPPAEIRLNDLELDKDALQRAVPDTSRRISSHRQGLLAEFLRTLRGMSDLASDAPAYDHFGNIMMHVMGQISMDSIARGNQFLLLLVLSGFWAWTMAKSEELVLQFLLRVGIVWLGLTILPLMAGSFPLYREREIRAMFELTRRQRLALWLEKAFGIYISAFLGEAAALATWISLVYMGLWPNLPFISKVIFWLFSVWVTSGLSLVGATIAVQYLWNQGKQGQAPRLRWDGILLGLGFPFIVYPALFLFVWDTASLWSRWQTGCPIIIVASLLWVLLLRREVRR